MVRLEKLSELRYRIMINHQSWIPENTLPNAFFDVAAKIYQDKAYWIKESEAQIRQQFSAENPYFKHCEAKVIVYENEARVVAFFNPNQQIDGETVAYFGFWETVNNVELNRVLFSQVETWAKSKGATRLYGPIDFSTYGENRIRINSFTSPAFIGEPFNPDYYPELLSQLGFGIKYNYVSRIHDKLLEFALQVRPFYDGLMTKIGHEFTITQLTPEIWLDKLDQFYPMIDQSFKDNFAYTPVSWTHFKHNFGQRFAGKLCPKTSVLVLDKQGGIAAFLLCFPDYGELVNQQGEQLDVAELNYSTHYNALSSPRLLLMKTGGADPKYRSKGLSTLVAMQTSIWANEYYEQLSGAMVREDNRSLAFLKDWEIERKYALFSKSLVNTSF
nr:Putative uncharacterized protein [Moritella viscosa]SHO01956.1 Putative uncharacterized protein [Moritella viscosa]